MSSPADPTADAGTLDDSTLEIEPAAAPPVRHAGTRACENCGAGLAGPYCAECGQRHHDHPVHHFWHFIGEATEDLTHADSRLWQTLFALLFRPGFLTREFLDGRRVRYLPPVRLYLVVSLLFFLVVGLHARLATPEVPVLAASGQTLPRTRLAGVGAVTRAPSRVAQGVAARLAGTGSTAAQQHGCDAAGAYLRRQGGLFARFAHRVTHSCLSTSATGGAARFSLAIEHNLERAMFLFLPLLALVMKPLYLKPPRYYVEHLLFFLHNHAFLFLVLGLDSLLKMLTRSPLVIGPLDAAVTIYIPVYFYLAMRRVYGQGRWLTLGKLITLGIAYSFLGALMFAATISYSFLMM